MVQLELGLDKEIDNITDYIRHNSTDEGFRTLREPLPTEHLPGSPEKVEVLRQRVENREDLWSFGDARVSERFTTFSLLAGIDYGEIEDDDE